MEATKISLHLLKVFEAAKANKRWLTAKELASLSNVAHRTARAHAHQLVLLGLFDLAEVFPAHRYRFSELADKHNRAMLNRLEMARETFGTDTLD